MPDARPPRRWGGWLALAVVVAAVVVLHFLGLDERPWQYLKQNQESLKETVHAHFALALLLFFVAYVLVTGLSLPLATVLSLAVGALFDRWWGTALVSFASTAGASVAFLLSRYLLRDAVRRRFGARLEALDRGFERDGVFYVLALRLTPVVPFFLVNLGLGLTRMPLRTFWWASQLGMLPATFLFVNFGSELEKIESPRHLLSPSLIGSLALLGLFPLAVRWVVRRLRLGGGD